MVIHNCPLCNKEFNKKFPIDISFSFNTCFRKYRIRFVKHNESNEYEELFDYTEFVLAKSRDGKSYTIVTSAYSQHGDFLKKNGKGLLRFDACALNDLSPSVKFFIDVLRKFGG